MVTLHIALQIGFAHDAVTITANGAEVYRKGDVTTRPDAGLADSVDVPLPPGSTQIVLALANRGTTATVAIDLQKPTYVGFLVGPDGRITHQVSQQPFAYM